MPTVTIIRVIETITNYPNLCKLLIEPLGTLSSPPDMKKEVPMPTIHLVPLQCLGDPEMTTLSLVSNKLCNHIPCSIFLLVFRYPYLYVNIYYIYRKIM